MGGAPAHAGRGKFMPKSEEPYSIYESSPFYEDVRPDAESPYGDPPHSDVLSEYGKQLLHYARRTVDWWLEVSRNPRNPPSLKTYPLPFKGEFIEGIEPAEGLPAICIIYNIQPQINHTKKTEKYDNGKDED
jgi:hypothetical protein